MSLGHFPGARNGGYGCDVNWSNMRATTALWRGRRPETVSQYRFWPGGLRSVVAGCVPEITLIEKDVHRANKAHSGFNACEGPHLQGGSIHQSLIKTSEIGVARKSPERRPPGNQMGVRLQPRNSSQPDPRRQRSKWPSNSRAADSGRGDSTSAPRHRPRRPVLNHH